MITESCWKDRPGALGKWASERQENKKRTEKRGKKKGREGDRGKERERKRDGLKREWKGGRVGEGKKTERTHFQKPLSGE